MLFLAGAYSRVFIDAHFDSVFSSLRSCSAEAEGRKQHKVFLCKSTQTELLQDPEAIRASLTNCFIQSPR